MAQIPDQGVDMNKVPLLAFLLLIFGPAPVRAAEQEPPGAAESRLSATIGLSYLGTGGNARVSNLGFDLGAKWGGTIWSLEGAFSWMTSHQEGFKQAERLRGQVRGSRHLGKVWSLFLAPSWERDLFSGFAHRWGIASGLSVALPLGTRDQVTGDVGISWNRDIPVTDSRRTFMGGMCQLRYTHAFTETSRLEQRVLWVPDFKRFKAWTGESETALVASLGARLALKASFLVRYRNEPLEGFKNTDTSTALSLVCTL